MSNIDIKILSVYNYMNEKQSDIYTNKIEKIETYGEVNSLTFEIPYYYYDADNELVYGDDGDKQVNPKISYLVNENIVEFEGYSYIIKNTKRIRSDKLYYVVECLGFGVELSYKNIGYISTLPPETNPLRITSNMLYLLVARNEDVRGYVSSYTSNSITLSGSLASGTNIYQGKYVAIIDGDGQGYNYEISSSSDDTININGSLFESLAVNKSLCIIHDSKYTIGNVDGEFLLNDDLSKIYRSFEFEDKSIMNCLTSISSRMKGYLTFNTTYDNFYGGYICEIGLKKSRDTYENIEFRYGKNLDTITKESDTIDNMYTVLYPYGEDNLTINDMPTVSRTDHGVTYNEHTNGQSYIENYQYYLSLGYDLAYCRKNFFNDISLKDTNYVSEQDLYDDFSDKLEEISVPELTYNVNGSNLSIFDEYSYMDFSVGDKTRVFDSELGISIYANVMKKTTDYSNIDKMNIEISNIVNRFSDYIQQKFSDVLGYTDKKASESERIYLQSNYNILNNGGCELKNNINNEPSLWNNDNASLDYIPITDSSVFNGTQSFSIKDTSGSLGSGSLYQRVDTIVNFTYYTASLNMIANNCDVDLIITEYNSSDVIIKSYIKKYKTLISNKQKLETSFKSNGDTSYVIFEVKKYNSEDAQPSYVYFDNCKLEIGENSTPYIDIESKAEDYANAFLGNLSKLDEITTTDIANGAIKEINIDINAVTETKISDGSISTLKIQANAITSNTILANAIISDKIATNAIISDKIATNAIVADKIATNAITAGKISVTSLSAINADLGTITAGTITAVTINGATIDIDDNVSVGNSINIGVNDNSTKILEFTQGATTGAQVTFNPSVNEFIIQSVLSGNVMEIRSNDDIVMNANGDITLSGTNIELTGSLTNNGSAIGGSSGVPLTVDSPNPSVYMHVADNLVAFYRDYNATDFIGLIPYN